MGMNFQLTGTSSGLSKLPYLRDTRRPVGGLDGFRITYADVSSPDKKDSRTAMHWDDAVGIGVYWFADIHKMDSTVCPYPTYFAGNAPVLPYDIPFRALTVKNIDNVLVSGKTMAQTFYANAAIRLHPQEWASGAAAGAAAAFVTK